MCIRDSLRSRLQAIVADHPGSSLETLPRAGAAGGLAGGLALLGARLVGGFGVVADEVQLNSRIVKSDVVVTGEGQLDAESFEGKVVGGVAALAHAAGVPVLVLAGRITDEASEMMGRYGVTSAIDLTARFGEAEALAAPVQCIRRSLTSWFEQAPGPASRTRLR